MFINFFISSSLSRPWLCISTSIHLFQVSWLSNLCFSRPLINYFFFSIHLLQDTSSLGTLNFLFLHVFNSSKPLGYVFLLQLVSSKTFITFSYIWSSLPRLLMAFFIEFTSSMTLGWLFLLQSIIFKAIISSKLQNMFIHLQQVAVRCAPHHRTATVPQEMADYRRPDQKPAVSTTITTTAIQN